LLGNIRRLEALQLFGELGRNSDICVDWFGNGPKASWLRVNASDLERDNIFGQGFLPDAALLERLKRYPLMILPSGSLGPDDPNVVSLD